MRRNAFASLQDSSTVQTESTQTADPTHMSETQAQEPRSALDFIPTAAPRKKRDRSWEKERQDQVATYRGIPPVVREGLISLANMLNVPVDEIARAFLEYGITQYQSGVIRLNPYPKAQRMTLFARDGNGKSSIDQGWLKAEFPRIKKTGKKKKNDEHKLWEYRVSYRIPSEVKQSVRAIADRHSVPIGEVAHYFFNAGLDAFQAGNLILDPQPKNIGNTLF